MRHWQKKGYCLSNKSLYWRATSMKSALFSFKIKNWCQGFLVFVQTFNKIHPIFHNGNISPVRSSVRERWTFFKKGWLIEPLQNSIVLESVVEKNRVVRHKGHFCACFDWSLPIFFQTGNRFPPFSIVADKPFVTRDFNFSQLGDSALKEPTPCSPQRSCNHLTELPPAWSTVKLLSDSHSVHTDWHSRPWSGYSQTPSLWIVSRQSYHQSQTEPRQLHCHNFPDQMVKPSCICWSDWYTYQDVYEPRPILLTWMASSL